MGNVPLHGATTRFVDRVYKLLEISDYRPAVTEAEREEIFRLRYDAYLREDAIESDPSRRLTDRFDDLDNTWNFGVFIHGQIAGAMRLSVATKAHPEMPAASVFEDYVVGELARGQCIIDPTRFVVDQDMARSFPELPYVTTRIGALACDHFGADQILATVRTEHQAFYKRIFGHVVVRDVRPYYSLTKPLSLMVMNYPELKGRLHSRFPFFRSSYFERRALFDVPGLPVGWSRGKGTDAEAPVQERLLAS